MEDLHQKYTIKRQKTRCTFIIAVHIQEAKRVQFHTVYLLHAKESALKTDFSLWKSQDITNILAHRGYPKELIVRSFLKANKHNRNQLLSMDDKSLILDQKIRLITMYNIHNPPMKDILQRKKTTLT